MERTRTEGGKFILYLLLFVSITAGLYYGSTFIDPITLRLIAIGLLYAVIFLVPLAYYFGHSEARGFLSGADKITDQTLGKMIEAMERKQKTERMQVPFEQMEAMRPNMVMPEELQNGRKSRLGYQPKDEI